MITREQLEQEIKKWWYYSAELAPGLFAKGIYGNCPYMPRMLMRQADLRNADCLDLGCMEGVLQVLMHRGGAKRILATDAVPHCADKMALLKEIYSANWDFRETGLMYDLSDKLAAEGSFDFVNLSGVLYHVFSPLHTLASIRPLVKKNGLFMIATNVINELSDVMHFNTGGRQENGDTNTFWYPSIPLLEYFLRYFNFAPIDCLYMPVPSDCLVGYGSLCIVCRAVESGTALPAGDDWARRSMLQSWDYLSLSKQRQSMQGPASTISYKVPGVLQEQVARDGSINLFAAVNELGRRIEFDGVERGSLSEQDTFMLRLDDQS
jgi:2-polyprenyl-3-methyl-5-hydroxy-6-metoxy-1,4-benzoquinol methylase